MSCRLAAASLKESDFSPPRPPRQIHVDRGGIGSGSDLKGEDKSKVSEDGKMFKLSDFASPTFDPHDFVESHLVNRKDCSKT